jgi:hypothetical protein
MPAVLGAAAPAWLPDWFGAAVALGALAGVLLLYWKDGALRMGFLASFLAAFALAAAASRWLAWHG